MRAFVSEVTSVLRAIDLRYVALLNSNRDLSVLQSAKSAQDRLFEFRSHGCICRDGIAFDR